MKHINYFFISCIILLLSCSKNSESLLSEHSGPLDVNSVKEWYNKINKGTRSKSIFSKLTPDWKNAASIRFEKQEKYLLQIPFIQAVDQYRVYEDTQVVKLPQPQLVIYFDDHAKEYKSGILEVIPEYNFYKKHSGSVYRKDFTGEWYLRNSDGTAIEGYKYENGKIIAKLSVGNNRGGRANSGGCECKRRAVFSAGCQLGNSVIVIAKEYISNCDEPIIPQWTFEPGMRCDNFQIIEGPREDVVCWSEPETPTDPNNGGGGDINDPSQPNWKWYEQPGAFIFDIINNLNNECFKSVLGDMLNASFKSEVQIILRNFKEAGTREITFAEGILEDGTDADEIPTNATSSQITLNSSDLAYASEEYIAATIYHEVLHSYLRDTGILRDTHHNLMANNFVIPMADALRGLFPNLSQSDAEALAWGGLQETTAWKEFEKVDLMRTRAIAIVNQQYKNKKNSYKKQHGHYCS
ncbi:hypothetical protein [Siphonobacter sp. SORGH_AS_1065]|uniref:hypothetical protein n=1 Tax=Siphonobacter sp. SORGH_AS_1065 TaxID=3041795 RepID=UPI0027835351|nr:hypothetical protein [Siphonobacter sp. SORGH_AS_1065]MDQ1090203.1 hypothetical protein [Siphonobacter sp. SORGH_AS_1065]